MPESEEEFHTMLVEYAQKGDEQAFAALYNMHRLPVYQYLAGHVGKDDAYDLSQDVFLKAFAKLSSLQNASKFTSWLYRIARNCAYDYLRHKRRCNLQSLEDISEMEMAFDNTDLIEHITQQELIQRVLARLPLFLRDCLLLHVVGGFSPSEIASIFDKKEGSIKTYLSKARRLFRENCLYFEQQSESTEREVESDG